MRNYTGAIYRMAVEHLAFPYISFIFFSLIMYFVFGLEKKIFFDNVIDDVRFS